MKRAVLSDQGLAIDTDDLVIGEGLGHDGDSLGIGLDIIGREEYGTIYEIKIRIGGRKARPVVLIMNGRHTWQRNEPIRCAIGFAKSLDISLHCDKLIVLLIGGGNWRSDVDYRVGWGKADKRVDMAIGIVSDEKTMVDP